MKCYCRFSYWEASRQLRGDIKYNTVYCSMERFYTQNIMNTFCSTLVLYWFLFRVRLSRSFTNHVKLDVRVKYFVLDHTNKKVLCKCTHNCQSPLIKFYQRCSIKSVDSPPVLNLDWQHFPDLWRKHQRQHFSELSTYIDMLHICQQSCAISEHRYVDKICSFFFQ